MSSFADFSPVKGESGQPFAPAAPFVPTPPRPFLSHAATACTKSCVVAAYLCYAASLQMEWELVIQDFRYTRRKVARTGRFRAPSPARMADRGKSCCCY
jgi:hypothetical protein